jgi:hypothetical protein
MASGTIYHFGHSSAVLTQDGFLFEIRRGTQRFTDIPSPRTWSSYEHWTYDVLHGLEFDVFQRLLLDTWTPDQVFAQQWFERSNLELETVSQEGLDQLLDCIQTLQADLDICLQYDESSGAYRDGLYHSICLLKNEYNEGVLVNNAGGHYRIHMNDVSPVLVKSGSGLLPLYMNLETGLMGTVGMTLESCKGVFGTSFAELGLTVSEVYRLEFGQYIRVA